VERSDTHQSELRSDGFREGLNPSCGLQGVISRVFVGSIMCPAANLGSE